MNIYFIFEIKSKYIGSTLLYTFVTGCLHHLNAVHTHPSVTSSRRSRPFPFNRTRHLFDSDITHAAFPFTLSNGFRLHRLLNCTTTPSIHAAAIVRIQTHDTVIFHCVICILRSNPSREVFTLTTHLPYSSGGFHF